MLCSFWGPAEVEIRSFKAFPAAGLPQTADYGPVFKKFGFRLAAKNHARSFDGLTGREM